MQEPTAPRRRPSSLATVIAAACVGFAVVSALTGRVTLAVIALVVPAAVALSLRLLLGGAPTPHPKTLGPKEERR